MVGQRLTRAFARKRKPRGRTSSFVDGEATAPLVPSKPLPRNAGPAPGPATMRDIFTYRTVVTLLAYSFLAFHSVAYDQNITVFLSTPVIPRTPDNFKPPFYFNGGFGLDPGTIGTIFTIYGVTSAAVQFILYPALVSRYGVLRTFHFSCTSVPAPPLTHHTPANQTPLPSQPSSSPSSTSSRPLPRFSPPRAAASSPSSPS